MKLILVLGWYPLALTLINTYYLFFISKTCRGYKREKIIEYTTIISGIVLTSLYSIIDNINFKADWQQPIIYLERHTPIWTSAKLSILVFIIVGIMGYFYLSIKNINQTPPLMTVLAISCMYIGLIQCIVWMIQISNSDEAIDVLFLSLLPINCIIIAIKTIRQKIVEWNKLEVSSRMSFKNTFLNKVNEKLMCSLSWPLAAFVFMWPLLGFLICILSLFGQQPDSIIKAWTETSDWKLSQRVSPPSLDNDGHYLCTVAAGGHKEIVKPLRYGFRHDHYIIVNRQLCIANAFEQILEEYIPFIHTPIRKFYDNYGLPVARLINSKYLADLVYVLMKPLEWFFLIIIYLCDVRPEDRIARQYLPKGY